MITSAGAAAGDDKVVRAAALKAKLELAKKKARERHS